MGEEKSSVKMAAPTPGFCSGVGTWVDKVLGVGVDVGGNQTMVGEGCGVSVAAGCSIAEVSARLAQPVKLVMSPTRISLKKIDLVFEGEKIIVYW